MTTQFTLRPCQQDEWLVFAESVHAMWRDIGASPEQIKPGWRDEVLRFMTTAAEMSQFQGFFATANGRTVGSAGGQIMPGFSPDIWEPLHRQRGYVWGVYVIPEFRGQGIAQALTKAVVAHLQTLGCTQVLLHASPSGRSVYKKLGFVPSNEMKLMLPAVGEK